MRKYTILTNYNAIYKVQAKRVENGYYPHNISVIRRVLLMANYYLISVCPRVSYRGWDWMDGWLDG